MLFPRKNSASALAKATADTAAQLTLIRSQQLPLKVLTTFKNINSVPFW